MEDLQRSITNLHRHVERGHDCGFRSIAWSESPATRDTRPNTAGPGQVGRKDLFSATVLNFEQDGYGEWYLELPDEAPQPPEEKPLPWWALSGIESMSTGEAYLKREEPAGPDYGAGKAVFVTVSPAIGELTHVYVEHEEGLFPGIPVEGYSLRDHIQAAAAVIKDLGVTPVYVEHGPHSDEFARDLSIFLGFRVGLGDYEDVKLRREYNRRDSAFEQLRHRSWCRDCD